MKVVWMCHLVKERKIKENCEKGLRRKGQMVKNVTKGNKLDKKNRRQFSKFLSPGWDRNFSVPKLGHCQTKINTGSPSVCPLGGTEIFLSTNWDTTARQK
jgi:hypothetical protein